MKKAIAILLVAVIALTGIFAQGNNFFSQDSQRCIYAKLCISLLRNGCN